MISQHKVGGIPPKSDEMNKINKMMIAMVAGLTILVCFASKDAMASTVYGQVGFVGTLSEYYTAADGYNAQLRVKISNSTCDSDSTSTERWIQIKSGRMDGQYVHNNANFRNTFSLLMAAFLSGKNVQIGGLPNCNASNTINLWSSDVGMY